MKNILILILGLVIGAGGYWFVAHRSHEDSHEEGAKHAEEEKHGEGSQAAGVMKLTKEQQTAAGLKLAQPEVVEIPKQIKAYGRVLDPGAVVALALDVQAARATFEASNKDFERVKGLFGANQNASARSLETAEAAVKRDRALAAAAEAKLQTAVGPKLAGRKDFADIVDSIAKMQSSLVRVDIIGDALPALPEKFALSALGNPNVVVEAEFIGPAPVSDPALQGQGYLGLIHTNALAANTAIVATFDDSSEKEHGFSLAREAAVQDGEHILVFVQTGEEAFKKVEVELEGRRADRVLVTGDLSPTNRVVIEGAHQILSISKAEPAE
jgi:hypothetical protein